MYKLEKKQICASEKGNETNSFVIKNIKVTIIVRIGLNFSSVWSIGFLHFRSLNVLLDVAPGGRGTPICNRRGCSSSRLGV